MKTRRFKVMEGTLSAAKSAWDKAAELRLRGQWLRNAGFHPGADVQCICVSPGVLELRIDSPAQLTAKDFQVAVAPFTKLGL